MKPLFSTCVAVVRTPVFWPAHLYRRGAISKLSGGFQGTPSRWAGFENKHDLTKQTTNKWISRKSRQPSPAPQRQPRTNLRRRWLFWP
ncbi:hypothetical protein H9L39_04548 [Fusarium oxysporum f. sp. albedinis]|nr:hypothetical protein H9L39_04548 [Fusarium oxysporum f. sp. albedinis]